MFITKKHISRRTVLKGAGVNLALPFLSAMVPASTALAQTAAAPKLRAGFFYLPHGAIMNNTSHGAQMDRWMPSGSGAEFKLNVITQSLEPFKNYVTSFGNLKNDAVPRWSGSREAARTELDLDRARPLLVLGSVRPGEARLLAGAWRALPEGLRARWQVAAVPRHARATADLREEAAHSTVTLADTSSAQILPSGLARELLGPRLVGGPKEVSSRRSETAQGWTVDATHDAYLPQFGIRHERQITLSPQGLMLTGCDRLIPAAESPKGLNFAVRFHIHPDIRVSRLEGGGILLKLPNGEGWRFRAGGGILEVEESVYLGGAVVRRAEQLVVSGTVKKEPAEIAWVFEHVS